MDKPQYVHYKGMLCKLFESYFGDDDSPLVMITSPDDIDKAYELGFDCIGYPDEVAMYLTEEEYALLTATGRID